MTRQSCDLRACQGIADDDHLSLTPGRDACPVIAESDGLDRAFDRRKLTHIHTGGYIPQLNNTVVVTGHEELAIAADRHRFYRALMAGKRPQLASRLGAPDLDRTIEAAGRYPLVVRTDSDRLNVFDMTRLGNQLGLRLFGGRSRGVGDVVVAI